MNITTKTIIIDTNIITDLNNANLLNELASINNLCISDMIKNDEINNKTGNLFIINKLNIVTSSSEELIEVSNLGFNNKQLSQYDLLNYVIAKNNNYILATGDDKLQKFAESNDVEVIRTIKIIELMLENNIISADKELAAYKLLYKNKNTRIPNEILLERINKYEVVS